MLENRTAIQRGAGTWTGARFLGPKQRFSRLTATSTLQLRSFVQALVRQEIFVLVDRDLPNKSQSLRHGAGGCAGLLPR